MKLSLDRSLRIIWLAIGVLLLALLVVGGGMILAQVIGNRGAGQEAVRVASESGTPRDEPRAVRLGHPNEIRGTATRLVAVQYGRGYGVEGAGISGGGYASSGRNRSDIVANVIFLDAAGARLLLDRPAYIDQIIYPRHAEHVQRWIEYTIALDDTNRDGKLDARDAITLYVSDLEGRNLRPVLRPPLRLLNTLAQDTERMLVYALEPPAGEQVSEERMRQRAFIYHVPSGRLSPYTALDSAAERAGRILRR